MNYRTKNFELELRGDVIFNYDQEQDQIKIEFELETYVRQISYGLNVKSIKSDTLKFQHLEDMLRYKDSLIKFVDRCQREFDKAVETLQIVTAT